jgi:ABC-2 type transport system permease protein
MVSNFAEALRTEFLKARRSRVPLFTALGFSLAPIMGGFFMIILKDPQFARNVGLLRTKADLISGTADWPTYFGLLSQATAVGGILVFALIASWVFGREFGDRTAKDFLALPTPRSSIIAAKFVVVGVWCGLLAFVIYVLGIAIGAVIVLPQWSLQLAVDRSTALAVTALLTILLMTPVAFVASAGRGYLPPMGFAILVLVLAQVLGAAGWGPLFPWSVPALFAGLGEHQSAGLDVVSYIIVGLTSFAGLIATFLWWQLADHTQ